MYIKRIAIAIVAVLLIIDIVYTSIKLFTNRYAYSVIPGWHVKVISPYQHLEIVLIVLAFICGIVYLVTRFVKNK